jgi:peroxiredoxin
MEFTRYRDDSKQYETLDAEVVGISVDAGASNRAWAAKLKLPFRLLSDVDPKGNVGRQYGVWDETWGFDGRATFVIDKKGMVRLADTNALALDPSRALAAVRKITAAR